MSKVDPLETVLKVASTPATLGIKVIETVGNILTGAQNANVEAARIAAEANEKREQREQETNKISSMHAMAKEADQAQRKQLEELLREQAKKEKEMANASIEERQAMRKEFIEARKEKEEEVRRIHDENRAQISEATRLHQEKMSEMQGEVKRLNEQQLETVQECSKMMLDQAEKQRAEMNEVTEARMREQKESALKIEEMHVRETGLIKGFAAAAINMTITQANARENATIVELSNSLRDSLSETRTLHHNAVEQAQMAMNDFNFVPASVHFGALGQKVDWVDLRRAEFVRALNRANIANKQLIAQQMAAIGNLELALSVYRTAVGSLRSKMTSSTGIDQADIDGFNAVQLELTKRMIDMPLIDANDVYGEITASAQKALSGTGICPVEQ